VRAGLIALVVLTMWAVASVSVWWVPAYLALMVLIFAVPHRRHPSKSALEAGAESVGIGIVDLGQGLRVDRADGMVQHHPVAEHDSGPAASASTDPQDSSPGSAGASTRKLKRGRVRVRKAAKVAAEAMPDSAVATWIQVGPGKFVRVEGGMPAADGALAQEVAVGVSLATDTPEHAPPTSTASADALAALDPPDTPETTPGVVGVVFVSDDCALGSVTEEYGIAPSAFRSIPMVNSSVENRDRGTPEVVADSGCMANHDVETSCPGVNPERLWLQWPISRGQAGRVSRGIVSAIARVARVSLRHSIPVGPNSRTLAWSSIAPNARMQQAMRRAFGRTTHVQRTLRPRSPPYSYNSFARPGLPAETRHELVRGGLRPVEPARRCFTTPR
jgi:hypothetical protein